MPNRILPTSGVSVRSTSRGTSVLDEDGDLLVGFVVDTGSVADGQPLLCMGDSSKYIDRTRHPISADNMDVLIAGLSALRKGDRDQRLRRIEAALADQIRDVGPIDQTKVPMLVKRLVVLGLLP